MTAIYFSLLVVAVVVVMIVLVAVVLIVYGSQRVSHLCMCLSTRKTFN